MKFIKEFTFPSWLKNRYALTVLIFCVWLAFFDKNDIISQFKLRGDLRKLEAEKEYYLSEIKKDEEKLEELISNKNTLEKFARERYLMKRDNEEIFVIVKE